MVHALLHYTLSSDSQPLPQLDSHHDLGVLLYILISLGVATHKR